jgi:hypothetical protein
LELENDLAVHVVLGSEVAEDLVGRGVIALAEGLEGGELLVEFVEQKRLVGRRIGGVVVAHGRRD